MSPVFEINLSVWTPVIIAIISAAAAVYSVYKQTKRERADIAIQVGTAWEKLSSRLERRVTTLEKENELLRVRERLIWNYVEKLRARLKANNIQVPDLPTLPIVDAEDEEKNHEGK